MQSLLPNTYCVSLNLIVSSKALISKLINNRLLGVILCNRLLIDYLHIVMQSIDYLIRSNHNYSTITFRLLYMYFVHIFIIFSTESTSK